MFRRVVVVVAVFSMFAASGCSGCDSPTATRGSNSPEDGGEAGDVAADGDSAGEMEPVDAADGAGDEPAVDSAVDGEGADSSGELDSGDGDVASCPDGGSFCDGGCVDQQVDGDHCGRCGNQCEESEACIDGECRGCSGTKWRCDGECVAVETNPEHCGACGEVCETGEVCSSGRCVAEEECLAGRKACGRTCVDVETNDEHCSDCGESCAADEGCVNGKCVERIPVGDAPEFCAEDGDPIEYEDRRRRRCTGRTASQTFRWAICSCSTVETDDPLVTDAFDSAVAPYRPGGLGGGVGANESIETSDAAEIYGAAWAAGGDGIATGGETDVRLELHSDGPLAADDPLRIRDDAFVDGDVSGNVTVDGQLTTTSTSSLGEEVTASSTAESSVDVAETCSRCGPDERVPIKSIVANHRPPDHDDEIDNGAIGLDYDALSQNYDEPRRIDIPCGEYYLDSIGTGGTVTVVTHGYTALYIDGDVTSDGSFTVKPAPGSTLDVFIAGDVAIDDGAVFGSPSYPASMRIYIGGPKGLEFDDKSRIGANVYAVPGGVASGGDAEFFGSIYASELTTDGSLDVHYDRGVLEAGRVCPTPGDGSGGDGDTGTGDAGDEMDAGTGDEMDAGSSDDDAGGGGDTCGNSGDACGSDEGCCSPLVCHENSCQLLECKARGERCDKSDECCTGTCAESVCVGS